MEYVYLFIICILTNVDVMWFGLNVRRNVICNELVLFHYPLKQVQSHFLLICLF